MKKVLIRQPAGLGDIFMCLKIAKHLQNNGYEIIWPVLDHYLYINDYLITDFKFTPISTNFLGKELFNLRVKHIVDSEELLYIPLQDASHTLGDPIMNAKYRMVNLQMDDYLDYFNFKRIEERENQVFNVSLDLIKGVSKYKLKNKNYASLPDVMSFERQFFNTGNNLYSIDMVINNQSHIFDWCTTIENATEFHTVSTAITFITEKLDVSNTKLFMYRRKENSISQFNDDKNLFKKEWIYIE